MACSERRSHGLAPPEFCVARAQQAQVERREDERKDHDQQRVGRGDIRTANVVIEVIGLFGEDRELTSRQRDHDREDLEGEDGAQNKRYLEAWPEHWQSHMAEALPGIRAEHFGRFAVILWNDLES